MTTALAPILLPLCGIQTSFVNAHNLAEIEAAIRPNTKAIYLETLGNLNSDIPDIDAVAAITHAHQIALVIDNTFGTPYLIRPIEHGADVKSLVTHPATTTHSQLSVEELEDQDIHPNTIHLSIGAEHIDDILADLEKRVAAEKSSEKQEGIHGILCTARRAERRREDPLRRSIRRR